MTHPQRAYIICLSFEPPGPVHINTWLAPDAASAAALAAIHFMRRAPTEANLMACLAVEMPAEQLRHLLRAVEGKLPDSGNAEVLSLVPKCEPPVEPAVPMSAAHRQREAEADFYRRIRAKGAGSAAELFHPPDPPLDAADALTFTGRNVDELWARHLGLDWGRSFDWGEMFGPPAPDPAA